MAQASQSERIWGLLSDVPGHRHAFSTLTGSMHNQDSWIQPYLKPDGYISQRILYPL